MNQESQTKDITPKFFFITMGFLFVLLQVAFHPEYIKYFPEFLGFNWLHHIHGALMASWVVILTIQPYLIYKGKYKAHRFIGKVSYFTVPLMIISMFLATRQNYLTTIGEIPFKEVASIQALNFIAPLIFLLFYSLAIINKKDVFKHQRYMIGTSFIMLTAILSRILQHSFEPDSIQPYDFFIPLYFSVIISALLLVNDIIKKKNPFPYTIVMVGLLVYTMFYHARSTEVWQSVVRSVGAKFF
jgi:hypothetical protein